MAGKFEIYEDAGGGFRWRLKAANGEMVAASESYTRKSDAVMGVDACQRAADGATIEDQT